MEVIFLETPWGHQWVRIDAAMMILYSAGVDLQYFKLNYLDCSGQPLLLTRLFRFFWSQGIATPCLPSPVAEEFVPSSDPSFHTQPPRNTCKVCCAKDSSPALLTSRIYWKHQSFVHPWMQSPELVELCCPHPRAADLHGICGTCDICAQPISSERAQGLWYGKCRGKQHLRASAAAACPWYSDCPGWKGSMGMGQGQMPHPTWAAA